MVQRSKTRPKAKVIFRPTPQWAMAAVGGLVTVTVIGVVVWEALQPPSPPILDARIVDVQPMSGGYLAEVKITNDGADTAAAVDLLGRQGDGPPSTATVDYVPGHGHATAWLRFARNPQSATVEVVGWSQP